MRKALALGVVALAMASVIVGTASAATYGWHKLGSASDISDYYASAMVTKSYKHTHALGVQTNRRGAKVTGWVNCMNGWDMDSYDFAYVVRTNAWHSLTGKGDCSILARAELENGGSVTVSVWAR
jgi:hypothetical protein